MEGGLSEESIRLGYWFYRRIRETSQHSSEVMILHNKENNNTFGAIEALYIIWWYVEMKVLAKSKGTLDDIYTIVNEFHTQ